jgi:AAA domain-containing protein
VLNSHRRRLIREDLHIPLPRLLPATELMVAALPERELLLDPILSSNTLALLYGPRGLGKTFVALGIAWAAASGASFLNWTASRPRRVLYIDGEMAAVDIRERLRLLGSAPPTLNFLVADLSTHSLPDLGYVEGQSRLQQIWGDPELVVLDNLSSLAGFKSGDPDCWTDLQRFLMRQRRAGRAVLVLHHANKDGEQRGTNRREDVLDLVMALREPRTSEPGHGAHFELHVEKARGLTGEAIEPIEARIETDALGVARWHWRPLHSTTLDRFVALVHEGLNALQAGRELGLSHGATYRLRNKAWRLGLLKARSTNR